LYGFAEPSAQVNVLLYIYVAVCCIAGKTAVAKQGYLLFFLFLSNTFAAIIKKKSPGRRLGGPGIFASLGMR
jgi:hypothetical protein